MPFREVSAPDHPAAEAHVSLPAEPVSVGQARALLESVLDEAGIEQGRRSPALLIASELVTNAISHGSGPGDQIGVDYRLARSKLSITVTDPARSRSSPHSLTANETREAGRGLNVVERFAEWTDRIVDGRREVRADLIL